jgi:hypothetical protein
MASFAMDGVMLPFQGKMSRIVIKGIYLTVQLPSLGTMANNTAYLKITPVG